MAAKRVGPSFAGELPGTLVASRCRNFGCLMLLCFLDVTYGFLFLVILMLLCWWSSLWL